jgi:hypothetical protein
VTRSPQIRPLALFAWLFFAALLPARPASAFSHDPTLAWRTLSSPHFDINYYPDTAALATRTAAICERRFSELSAYFKFAPDSRIQVVLADETDEANGETTALPYETIYLIVAPPDESLEIWDMDSWLDYVISHEMVHAFHLDHQRGFPHALRTIFGRIDFAFPNYFQPSWVLEGLATWLETDPVRHVGRGQDAFYRGLMRLELQNGLKPVRKVNQPLVTWPGGTNRYVYGVYFMKYLEANFGRDSVRRWVENYSRDWWPYMINRNARKTFGAKLPALWRDFQAWLDATLGAETRAITAQGLRGGPAPVDPAGGDGWGPYKAGYAVRNDNLSRPAIQRLEGGHWRTLGEAYVSEFWPGPDRILYTEDEVNGWADYTRDLWQMDPRSGWTTRLTHGLRVQCAVETQAGVFAVLGSQGQKRLVRLDKDGAVAGTLWQGRDEEDVASLCPSPDGRRLAASYWTRGRGWDVAEFDLATRAWIPRAAGPESEVQPSYSPDGRSLYFSADYGGTYNIYALDLGSKALTQVTNVVGGAFHPWPGPGGQLYFSLMTAHGMVLGQASLARATAVQVPFPVSLTATAAVGMTATAAVGLTAGAAAAAGPPTTEALTPLAGAAMQDQDYDAGPTLWPTSWAPSAGVSTFGTFLGLQVSGADLLDRHHFTALAYGGGGIADAFGGLAYAYTRWLPELGVTAEKTVSEQASGAGYRNQLDQRWAATAEVPWQGTWRSWDLAAAAGQDWHRDAGGDLSATALATQETTAYAVGLAYDASTRPARALGSIDGLQASVTYERDNPGLADDHAWVDWSLARPTRLTDWLELEASLGGGHISLGSDVFTLNFRPLAGLNTGPLKFAPSLHLAGYPSAVPALEGPNFGQAELGLRFPIALVEWGIMAPPIGVDRVFGRAWGQGSQAYGPNGQGQGLFNTVGLELDTDFILLYEGDLELQLGVEKGLDAGGAWTGYASLVPLNFSLGGGGAKKRAVRQEP